MKVVVVGAGTAGVTLALRLLEKHDEVQVEMVDAGPRIEQGNRRTWIDFLARGSKHDPYADYLETEQDQEDEGDRVLQLFQSRYFGVGGSTNAWGGWCVRYQPEDFALRTLTGFGADWPFVYDDLLPFYERAEKTLWVAGEGKPNPALPFTLKDGVIIEALDRLGIGYEHLPLARRESCVTIGTCKYCPVLQRYVPHLDLRELEGRFKDRFLLETATVALKLKMASRTRCVGVHVLDRATGKQRLLEADQIVLALGAVETPKLLLSSASREWPDGVGNMTGHVGRHITAHPLVRVVGDRAGNPDNLEQPVDFPTLASRHFDTTKEQPRGKLFFVRDGRKNAAKIEERLRNGESLSQVRDSMRERMPFELRGFIEVFSDDNNFIGVGSGKSSYGTSTTRVQFSKTRQIVDAIGAAEVELGRILRRAGCENIKTKTYDTLRADHATSTCRMSRTEEDGVVDPDLCVHGTENVFVCSNAALPNGAAVNPTLTLVALAERLADRLAP